MKEFVNLLKKHHLYFSRELFYVLLNCIDSSIDTCEDLINTYKDREDFDEIKKDYKKFYEYTMKYLHEIDINKEFILHQKVIELVDLILQHNPQELQKELKMFISNVIDLIFMKYKLNITQFNKNEEIKEYLLKEIKDEKIVDLLVLLLLADTSLDNKNLDHIPEEEFERIISSIILIAIYICKGEKK